MLGIHRAPARILAIKDDLRDEGSGVLEEQLELMLEPFARLNQARQGMAASVWV
ncbi:hypothetical protein SA496_19695 [Pseudomonas sp. JS3066]|uniref:hypothetical protein n=1 Tax=unclassified Pseudomonas TaxID=196821 RepID=UPI00129E6910|nr:MULTISPECIES: hypothetical protein [unclassified Pseudomonas]WVK91928.1 hypothetical protein SA496_19695 [Pseudomonas sp. JS3066]